MPGPPLHFVFALHNHQPVGNDPRVIGEVARAAYRPLLDALSAAPWFRHTLHLSGPLLEWLERSDTAYLDRLGEMVARGQVELLTGGLYEPVLASIPSEDRRAQIEGLSERLRRRFGVAPQGLWLTERAWEPQIVPDLVASGVRYVLMDDRAFVSAGFPREALTSYFLTEEGGARLAIFPIDQRLRLLMPWRPVPETRAYLESLHARGHRVAVFGDDGEKFGAWPEAQELVYGRGWLKAFLGMLEALAGTVEPSRMADVLEAAPAAGLCYLPTSSYIEMEAWALPPAQAAELGRLRDRLGEEAERFAPFIRGSHWKHFLVRYPEANLAHKKMLALRERLPRRKAWASAWAELYAAQCNDPFWHGWFGGVYLPRLRHETWRHLARAERALRRRQPVRMEQLDLDLDGQPEVWIHSSRASVVIRPARGGTVVEWTDLGREVNVLNVLTRRPEQYHDRFREGAHGAGGIGPTPVAPPGQALPDPAEGLAYDPWERATFRDHFLGAAPTAEAWLIQALPERGDFADGPYAATLDQEGLDLVRDGQVEADGGAARVRVQKRLRLGSRGNLLAAYRVESAGPGSLEGWFAVEANVFVPAMLNGSGALRVGRRTLGADADGATATRCRLGGEKGIGLDLSWTTPASVLVAPIRTLAQTERGFELAVQGHGLLFAWPIRLAAGEAWSQEIGARVR